MKGLALALAVVAAAGCATAIAQSDDQRLRELERRLEESRKTIEELKARVNELEARTPAPAAAPAARAAPTAPAEEHEHRMPAGSAVQPPTPLRAFLDVGANFSGHGGNKGFSLGALDFYLTPQLTTNIKSVIELVFEHDKLGDLSVDLERMQVGYAWSDAATVWLGRFHTPLGYWNTAFHHGQQLQTSVLRPQMIDFEDHGGVLPVHTVGVLGTGGMRAAHGRVSYDLYVGNAPSINRNFLDPINSGKSHPGYSAGFNLGYRFGDSVEGPKVGVHGYRADVRDDAAQTNVTRVNIFGAYAALDSTLWELIAEYYRFRNEDLSAGRGRFGSWAGFAQLGRRFEPWTPYLRAEKAALNQADPYFAGLTGGRAYTREAAGLRYDQSAVSAIKVELNHTRSDNPLPESFLQLLMQWAIRF